jgi:hypothetical protein
MLPIPLMSRGWFPKKEFSPLRCPPTPRMSVMHEKTDPLDPLLERWRHAAPPQPESVGPEVWRRIAYEETPPARPAFWWNIELAFARPAFAVAFVAACVVFGLFLAEVRLSRQHAERSAHLERSYLELVDPLLTSGLPNPPPARVENTSLRP